MDQVLLTDTNGTMAWLQFEAMGFDRVKAPTVVTYADHQVYQFDARNTEDHRYLQTASRRFGGFYSKPGNGICHQVHLETFGAPGLTLLGTDSHTPLCGALGMLAIGAGGLDVACAMGGSPYYFPLPRVVQVVLTGRLRPWVAAKDVILELLRRLTVRGGFGKIFEYAGPGRGDPDGAPARDDREHGRRARPDHVDLPLGRGHAELPRAPRPRRDLAAARRGPGRPLRRRARDRPLDDRAPRRAARIPGPRRPGRRGRGHVDRAGPGRLVHQRLVGGHVRRRRGPARTARSRGRLVRSLPREPAGPRDDGAPGPGGGPHRGGGGHLRVDLRRVPRHRPRPGDRLAEPPRLQPELSRAQRSQGRPDLPLLHADGMRLRPARRDHGSAEPRRGARGGLPRSLHHLRRPASCCRLPRRRDRAHRQGAQHPRGAGRAAARRRDRRPGRSSSSETRSRPTTSRPRAPRSSCSARTCRRSPSSRSGTSIPSSWPARGPPAAASSSRARPTARARRARPPPSGRCSSGSAACWRRASRASTAPI